MNFNNNKITIVEEPLYLDIDNKENLWYFDAEKFRLDFPLACSYLTDNSPLLVNKPEFDDPFTTFYSKSRLYFLNGEFLSTYNYLSIVLEHFRKNKNLSVFIFESKYPNLFYSKFPDTEKSLSDKFIGGFMTGSEYEFNYIVDNIPNRKITIGNYEKVNGVLYLRLMVVAELDLDLIRSYFYSNRFANTP